MLCCVVRVFVYDSYWRTEERGGEREIKGKLELKIALPILVNEPTADIPSDNSKRSPFAGSKAPQSFKPHSEDSLMKQIPPKLL